MQLSAFRNTNVKLIMPVIIQEEKWSVPTAIARIVLVNGLEYELRAIGQAKVWLESLEEGTCYEGEIPASCVKKNDEQNRKFSGITSTEMAYTKFPLKWKKSQASWQNPLTLLFTKANEVQQMDDQTVFN